jgi:hypothetical protein
MPGVSTTPVGTVNNIFEYGAIHSLGIPIFGTDDSASLSTDLDAIYFSL